MKKLIITVIALFITVISFSQNTQWRSYRNEIGIWNIYTKTWNWQEMKYAYIPISFYKTEIRLTNVDKSVFYLVGTEGTKEFYNNDGVKIKNMVWSAIDKKGKNCRVTINRMDDDEYDPMIFTVMYSDVCIRFYCRSTSTDNFMND